MSDKSEQFGYVSGIEATEIFFEQEHAEAIKGGVLTSDLFHYTNADAAIFGILSTGTLRVSPFSSTNDLWESRPLHPNIIVHHDDSNAKDPTSLWEEIDNNIRLHAKVACLTQDWFLPNYVSNPDGLRGWAHLSLWAHYGAGHTGICLRFDKETLINCFMEQRGGEEELRFHGPVLYRRTAATPSTHGIDIGQVKEFGVDAVALAFAEDNRRSIFFRKHADWANESEYRLVLINQSVLPSAIDIRKALTGVIIGDSFPQNKRSALAATLEGYPDVEVHQLIFNNRTLLCFPTSEGNAARRSKEDHLWNAPRRDGSLAKRLAELRAAEKTAQESSERGRLLAVRPLKQIEHEMNMLASRFQSMTEFEVGVHQNVTAVPVKQRARRAGVPGEQVHYESGFLCVVENLPKQSCTLTIAAALQVVEGDQLRPHGVVSIERWSSAGNETTEVWRNPPLPTVSPEQAEAAMTSLTSDVRKAVDAALPIFDRNRNQA